MDKFEELVEQIEMEFGWAKETCEEDPSAYNRGMRFAYDSIMSKIADLKGEKYEMLKY